jgi:hypothetical protein
MSNREIYIKKHQNTVADYVATQPIFELSTKVEWQSGSATTNQQTLVGLGEPQFGGR